ncbi:hypothetical protein ACLI1A_03665 [Flavobacterium sp. RHBU_3]|uniref:hypothetical protein n=1 Tax=Flavobacterium sp. RHBU_3 TaxID=3391184 RepID=UPI0039849E34
MKKKLEAELISIAHRILKLKNRAELDQLQQETLNLYQKISVLKFVEDNFSDVKPTIGFGMAEQKLEDIYNVIETAPETVSEITAPEKEETTEEITAVPVSETAPASIETEEETPFAETTEETEVAVEETIAAEPEATEAEETPIAEEEAVEETDVEEIPEEEPATEEPVIEATTPEEEAPAAEEVHHLAEQPVSHHREEITAEVSLHEDEQQPVTEVPEMPEVGTLPETAGEDTENGTGEGIDIPTGEPAVSEEEAEITEETTGTEINFDRKEPAKQREIVFEDFSGFVQPEFVKKEEDKPKEEPKAEQAPAPTFDDWMNWEPKKDEPKEEEPKETPKTEPVNPVDDWMNWEPTKAEVTTPAEPETPKEEQKEEPKAEPADDWRNWEPSKPAFSAPIEPEKPKEEPKPVPADDWTKWEPSKPAYSAPITTPEAPKETPKPAAPKFNDGFVRAMSLGLNDRIAFEKHLFGGSSEDLNRVVSQLNTINTFDEAKDFIADLVKPDYNNWAGKEEYENRFMELVEKKFS